MQTDGPADVLRRCLRVLALGLALVLGAEWCHPLWAMAQPSGTAQMSVENQELPPIQEAETVEVRSPMYKRWWFWTIVAVVVGGAAIAMAGGGGGGGSNGTAPASPGDVNVRW